MLGVERHNCATRVFAMGLKKIAEKMPKTRTHKMLPGQTLRLESRMLTEIAGGINLLAWNLHKSLLVGKDEQFETIQHLHFFENRGQMVPHRDFADA